MITDLLFERAKNLKLYGVISHWDEIQNESWLSNVIDWEETSRSHRSLERRIKHSRVCQFKPFIDFDWNWPKKIELEAIEELMQLNFIKETTNIILCGSNGVGKTTIAKNIAYTAIIRGYNALFVSASDMLSELASADGNNALRRRIKYYAQPSVLVIDEIGYLSYSNRYADLLFEIISRRYHDKPTIVTTNKTFAEWKDVFPNAACVVTLIDRLVHHSEIISIEADSYRLKEATEQAVQRKKNRASRKNSVKDKEVIS
jgi:DNA replication protein DnaC